MKKFTILIPVYNDWESLSKLLYEINSIAENIKKVEFKCVIINDASSEQFPEIKPPSNIISIELINMKENRGHARCNAFGIRYLAENSDSYDHVILMDGDGEDRPEEIKLLVDKALSDENISVVAKRIKRSEGPFFQLLYKMHKLITIFFTGKNINFGNYSCLTKSDILELSDKESLWSSFSGSLKYHIKILNSVNSIRGTRYHGPSKMSLFKLGIHSFSIIAVFKLSVFIRSIILIIAASYFSYDFSLISTIFQLSLVLFCLTIYLVSLRENKKNFLNSHTNLDSKITYTR
jgi:hypothetical protein|tara:strand:+ start:17 stop:892 length:876 start_codon:yes stop_codon:yes gene_type:complete